jgi:hypothetical protein
MAFSFNKAATFLGLKDYPELEQTSVSQESIPGGGVAIRPPRVLPVRALPTKPVAVQPEAVLVAVNVYVVVADGLAVGLAIVASDNPVVGVQA